jgi:hypothetical protein
VQRAGDCSADAFGPAGNEDGSFLHERTGLNGHFGAQYCNEKSAFRIGIQRALHTLAAFVQHMGIDHRG